MVYRLSDLLQTIESYGEKTAYWYADKSYSFQWLHEYALKVANWIDNEEIQAFAFAIDNSPLSVLLYLGAWTSGIDCCPINPRLKAYEILSILKRVKVNCLFLKQAQLNEELQAYCQEQAIKLWLVDEQFENAPCYRQIYQVKSVMQSNWSDKGLDANFSLTMHISSGSEDVYKIHAHSLEQIIRYAYARRDDMGYIANDKLLIALSINHAYAFSYQLLPALTMGLTSVLLPGYVLGKVVDNLETQEITATALLPTMYHDLIEKYQPSGKGHWRLPLVAGDYLTENLLKRFKSKFKVNLYNGLGMTEVYGYAQNTDIIDEPNRVKVFTGVKAQIEKMESPLTYGVHEVGEVMLEWDMLPVSLEEALLATGDLGFIDEQGYITICGRKKDIIIKGGSNISPLELEEIILKHPVVDEVSILGIPDECWGQRIVAVVSLQRESSLGEMTVNTLNTFMKEYLADYKMLDQLFILDSLPKNVTGKVDRKLLKQQLMVMSLDPSDKQGNIARLEKLSKLD